jgi:methionyl-tRNA formyltransferase
MKILFIGAVAFSAHALRELIAMHANVVGVCTLTESKLNSDHEDLTPIAEQADIPVYIDPDLHTPKSLDWIRALNPDVIFCFGWSQLIREPLLTLPPLGVIGFHPAELPANRGRHPLIWALVLGLTETASTFFVIEKGIDSGGIISQKKIYIGPADNASSLYARITKVALSQLRNIVTCLESGSIQPQPQDDDKSNIWRKRGPADSRIDWRMACSSIHNLVRGLTRPYVGAHFDYDNQVIKVWKTEIELEIPVNLEPGKVLAVDNNTVLIKAGIGAIRLLDFEPPISLKPGFYL